MNLISIIIFHIIKITVLILIITLSYLTMNLFLLDYLYLRMKGDAN